MATKWPAAAFCLFLWGFGYASAAEVVTLQSVTPRGPFQLIERDSRCEAIRVSGTLTFPENFTGGVPAMIVAHGSGGVTESREGEWARRINSIGAAALVIDSFGPRGIVETATDQSRLSTWADVADALNGLKMLASDSRIDPRRIGIIGFSKGAHVALWTALEPVRRSVISDSLKFALHVAVYPGCSTRFVASAVTGAPVSFHLGEKDDYTPIAPCRDYARWFESRGAPTTLTIYPGAYHGFDRPSEVRWFAKVQTGGDCTAEVDLDTGQWRRFDTDAVSSDVSALRDYHRRCAQRGAHIGGNAEAARQLVDNVLRFLKDKFRL